MKSITSSIIFLFFASALTSCNVYYPLNSNNSDLDKLEEAQKCLNDSDYRCAIEQYQEIKDINLKNKKLCQLYLTKGGLTLHVLINTLSKNSSQVLSSLAKELMPWNSARSADFDLAQTYCSALTSAAGSEAVFLKTVGGFTRCAFRMARSDKFKSTSDSTASCPSSESIDGFLTTSDIGGDGSGVLSAGSPGMCKVDVDTCRDDIALLSASELSSAGYTDLAGAMSKLPGGITNSSTSTVRAALKGTF